MKYRSEPGKVVITALGKYDRKPLSSFLDDYRQSDKNRARMIKEEQILVNDEPVKDENVILKESDTLTLIIPETEIDHVCAEAPCRVVYEDAFIYIAHKEAGCIIHGEPEDTECLLAQAAKYQEEKGIHYPVRPIHRLDRDTKGLVLFVKNPFFQPWFDLQLEEKKIRRNYYAVTSGRCTPGTSFTINEPIGRDRHVSGKYRISSTGKAACTKAECLEKKGRYLLFRCSLETGRTHQIRVHLSEKGFAIVNDPLY